jgi:hypothetical protein
MVTRRCRQAAEEVAHAGDLEPGPSTRGGALEAAGKAPPAAQLGEGVLGPPEHRERHEADRTRRLGPDLDVRAMTLRRRPEGAVAAVAEHGVHPWQLRQRLVQQHPARHDVVRPGGVDPHRHGQPDALDEDAPPGADGPAAPTTRRMISRPVATALHGLGVDDDA